MFRMTGDQNAKKRFENTATGHRLATSVGGIGTGEGGDRVVVDDPHNVLETESPVKRQAVLEWWDGQMSTRLNDASTGAFVIVMQRIHERDLAGHVLDREEYEHLVLPAEYEPTTMVTSLGWEDPRTESGQLLWPEKMPQEALNALKAKLGSHRAAGQLQQRPVPKEGGDFKAEWFGIVGAAPVAASKVRHWDLAATEQKANEDPDWTVGCLMSRAPNGIHYIEDVRRFRGSPHEVEQTIKQTAELDGKGVMISLPQDPGQAGKAQAAYYVKALAGYTVRTAVETGSKEVRAEPVAAQAEAGNVKLVKGHWNKDFIDEAAFFPFGAHDDQVDGMSGAFTWLLQKTKIRRPEIRGV